VNGSPRTSKQTVTARCARLSAKASDAAGISVEIEPHGLARRSEDEVLVKVTAAAVNQSDVKAATGRMAYAVFPRTPGRDFAGVVMEGPPELAGREVFGSSGDLGIRRDGTHATHLVVEAKACVLKPDGISLLEAAGIGVPFVTAAEGYRRAGTPKPGEAVLVFGVNGKVGQAAAQIASWKGARVIGVGRRAEPYRGHASGPVETIDASAGDVAALVREITGGKGADIVFNTVGDPYFEAAHKSLALDGRQVLLAAISGTVPFNIFEFYRGRHTYIGVDSLGLSSPASAERLAAIAAGFAGGALKPFAIDPGTVFPLEKAAEAFRAEAAGTRSRVLITMA
jgi:NADPH:quinone reductase-like Zn-dependent oxidoreductase